MKMSKRAVRMQVHHRRGRGTALNLVSLMDIFTILVFFLLVNSGEGEVLPSTRNVDLPESIAEQKPRENVVVMVTEHDILVQGSRIAVLKDVNDSGEIVPSITGRAFICAETTLVQQAGDPFSQGIC